MDKFVIKRIKITYGIFTSLLLVTLLCLALCSLLLVYSSDNIAYASSTNGIVEDNIFESDRLKYGTFTSGTSFNEFRLAVSSGSSLTINSDNSIVFSNPSSSGYYSVFIMNYSLSPSTYTLSCYVSSFSGGSAGLNVNNGALGTLGINSTGVKSFTFTNSVNTSDLRVFCNYGTMTVDWIKVEKSSSFTGYVPKDYENYGYNQGVSYGSNSTAFIDSGYILDKSVLLSDLEIGSTFTINNINYRFQGSTVLDNYFQTNVINSWPLGANGDTNHRYLGFLITDDLYKFSAIQISIVRDGGGYLYFSGDGLTPKVVDLSSLSPVSSYPFNYLNQSTYMDTFVIYSSEFTNVYYLSYLDTSSSSAGDTVFFNTINIYSSLDNSSWYDRGIETGKTLGYSEGYNKGYQEGSDYSGIPFYNMFGAIFDVPVQTINGLLDFKILGVDMKGFILGLISFCIILFILKIVFK